MSYVFVFCHGWGFDPYFWDPLRNYFSADSCYFLDLQYFSPVIPAQAGIQGTKILSLHSRLHGNDMFEITTLYKNNNLIGIGHSLGLIKLLSLNLNFKALIGINAFTNFLGQNTRIKRNSELQILKNHFQADPIKTLLSFYKRCGYEENVSHFLNAYNPKNLLSDLELLEQSSLLLQNIPLLILGSENDDIVPPEIIFDNFSQKQATIVMHDKGKHCLGYQETHFVKEKILDFLT